jgi:hypothetical protein
MLPDKERAIFDRWPHWFPTETENRRLLISCSDGWYNLVWQLLERLEPLVAGPAEDDGPQFQVVQVKQRFGELVVHLNRYTDETFAALTAAGELSRRTCEICGNPGTLDWETTRVWKTLCSSCLAADQWWRQGL